MDKTRSAPSSLAGIQYAGEAGCTQECLDAVIRLLHSRTSISRARLLTNSDDHALLLTIGPGDEVAVKSGFQSGYVGEGPRGLSRTLCFLDAHDVEIEEFDVTPDFIERLDISALRTEDLEALERANPRRPRRWSDYIDDGDCDFQSNRALWSSFCDPTMPLAIIDSRIVDLALSFWDDPDDRLLKAYRRLEDIVRARTNGSEHGAKLFSRAFSGDHPVLRWADCGNGEQNGRALLFSGAFQAHRNRRAHRELQLDEADALREFLLLNHLFNLEKQAVE